MSSTSKPGLDGSYLRPDFLPISAMAILNGVGVLGVLLLRALGPPGVKWLTGVGVCSNGLAVHSLAACLSGVESRGNDKAAGELRNCDGLNGNAFIGVTPASRDSRALVSVSVQELTHISIRCYDVYLLRFSPQYWWWTTSF